MTSDAAPVARVSLRALVENVRVAATAGDLVDLRRDAYGHGAAEAARALLAHTDARLLMDPADVARAELSGDRVQFAGESTVEPGWTYGWLTGALPVMTFAGTVLGVKVLRPGEGVSYGYRFRATADTRVALLTGGYAQGVPRSVGGQVSVALDGHDHPIVGRVAMDVCVVDIGDAPVARGDEAVFYGDGGPTVQDWAMASHLRPSEIVTAVGLHTRREYRR